MNGNEIDNLCQLAREGDRKAEEQVFSKLSARFHLFIRRRIADTQDREEVVQDALMAVCKDYKKVTFRSSFAAWAYKVLENRLFYYYQTKKSRSARARKLAEMDPVSSSDPEDEEIDLKQRLLNCLRGICKSNQRYARILNLHYQGYGSDEICERLSLTHSNYYSILSRARSLLEYCLGKGETD